MFPTQPAPGRPIKHAHAQSAPDFGRLNLRDNASTTQVSPISPSYSQAPGTMTPETQSRPPSPSFEQNSWNKRRRMHASASSLHHRGNSSLSRLPLQRYNTNLPGPAPSFIPPVNGFPNNYPLNAQQDMHPLYSPQFASGPCTQQPSFGNLSQYATTINNVQHFYPQQQSPATAPLLILPPILQAYSLAHQRAAHPHLIKVAKRSDKILIGSMFRQLQLGISHLHPQIHHQSATSPRGYWFVNLVRAR